LPEFRVTNRVTRQERPPLLFLAAPPTADFEAGPRSARLPIPIRHGAAGRQPPADPEVSGRSIVICCVIRTLSSPASARSPESWAGSCRYGLGANGNLYGFRGLRAACWRGPSVVVSNALRMFRMDRSTASGVVASGVLSP
jgi:hypothetical protein